MKNYKVANFRKVNYFEAKKEDVLYINGTGEMELDFELVFNIINDLVLEGRIVKISNDELIEKRGFNNQDHDASKGNASILKFKGKRLIVESRSKDYEFISIRHNADYKAILKNNGVVVDNATVIPTDLYPISVKFVRMYIIGTLKTKSLQKLIKRTSLVFPMPRITVIAA